jgi:ankyrin repeat protein
MKADHWMIGQVDPTRSMYLHRRIKRGTVEPVIAFLRGGGDPNLRYRQYSYTLLHDACANGIRQLAEALVTAGADIDALAGPGFTPLASAAHGGHVECVRLLLAAGASPACRPIGMSLIDSLECAPVKSLAVRKLLSLSPELSEPP